MKMKDYGFYRGVNLGGWFSQCDYSRERLDTFITDKDFDRIASWGLDHVRIPADYNIFEDEKGNPLPEGFDRIERAVSQAKARGLKIVLDLHKTCGFSFDSAEREDGFFTNGAYQERFYLLWERLAERFCDPEHVAFELLNEVTDQEFSSSWNRIAGECIRRIRRLAPRTVILVGSYWNNSAEAVKDLDPPADELVFYNFHCYLPLPFTHQGAPWVPQLDQSARISFEEAGITEEFFEKEFESAILAAERNHTCLYCGEYGVIDRAKPEDALKWYRTIHAVFEKHQISRAAWSYRAMDFGLNDARMDDVRQELIHCL